MFADIWLCVTVIIIIALYYMYTNRWPGEKLSAIYLLVEQTKNKLDNHTDCVMRICYLISAKRISLNIYVSMHNMYVLLNKRMIIIYIIKVYIRLMLYFKYTNSHDFFHMEIDLDRLVNKNSLYSNRYELNIECSYMSILTHLASVKYVHVHHNLCQFCEQVILDGRIYHESLRCNNPDTCKNALLYMIVILMVQFLYLVNHNTDTLYVYVNVYIMFFLLNLRDLQSLCKTTVKSMMLEMKQDLRHFVKFTVDIRNSTNRSSFSEIITLLLLIKMLRLYAALVELLVHVMLCYPVFKCSRLHEIVGIRADSTNPHNRWLKNPKYYSNDNGG